jgi:hypothetical protein
MADALVRQGVEAPRKHNGIFDGNIEIIQVFYSALIQRAH